MTRGDYTDDVAGFFVGDMTLPYEFVRKPQSPRC